MASITPKKIAVAVSGGVDSAMAAWLLKQEGHEIIGLHMLATDDGERSASRAGEISERLGIPLHVLDIRAQFRSLVIEPFLSAYRAGLTPNPCLSCNAQVKFGLLIDEATRLGADSLATGHYCRIEDSPDGPALLTGIDRAKDQSYFLSFVPRDALRRAVFPLGGMLKSDVRRLALETGLFTKKLPEESQDVCFLSGRHYGEFLSGEGEPGDIVDTEGNVLGRHHGLHLYTVGQRRGIGLTGRKTPLYVQAIDAGSNRLVVASGDEALSTGLIAGKKINWLAPQMEREFDCAVKTRYRQSPIPCSVKVLEGERLKVRFGEPRRGVAPGQGAVLYGGERVIAGGTIEEAL